jgi:hypothetical protein
LAVAESPAVEDANPCWRLHPGTDGHRRGLAGADERLKQRPARRPARLGPRTLGAECIDRDRLRGE